MQRRKLVLITIVLLLFTGYWGLSRFLNETGEILSGSRFNWYESQNFEEIEGANEFALQRLAKKYHVFVNGIFVDIGYEWDGIIHVPIRTVSSSLNWQVNWIPEMEVIQLVKGQEESYVDIVNFFGKAYVDLKRLENLLSIDKVIVHGGNIEIGFGNQKSVIEAVNIHDLEKMSFYINGMKMTDKAVLYAGEEYVPVQIFAQSYARKFCYDAVLGCVLLDDTRIESIFVDGQAYSTIEELQKIIDTGEDQLEYRSRSALEEEWPVINKGPQEKVVALTFDDYLSEQVYELLDVLEDNEVRGTFFLIGNSIQGNEHVLHDLVQRGHEPANHTWDHFNCHTLTDDEIRAQLMATQLMIKKWGHGESGFFRPPGGYYDARIVSIAQDIGLRTVLWTLNSTDADTNNGPEDIIRTVTRWVQPGSVIVMHTNRQSTKDALPKIIAVLKERGYRCVTLSEMLKIQEREGVKQ